LDYTFSQYGWTKDYTSLSWDGRKNSPMRFFNNGMYGVEMGSPSRKIFNVSKRKPDVRVFKISIRWGVNGLSERSSDILRGAAVLTVAAPGFSRGSMSRLKTRTVAAEARSMIGVFVDAT